MKILKPFLTDILTLRSHQWKYFIDPYNGCTHRCLYCIYGGTASFFKRVEASKNFLNLLEEDLNSLTKKQIIYVGATSDIYQPIEKQKKLFGRH
jgi:DNA repair photolyase